MTSPRPAMRQMPATSSHSLPPPLKRKPENSPVFARSTTLSAPRKHVLRGARSVLRDAGGARRIRPWIPVAVADTFSRGSATLAA